MNEQIQAISELNFTYIIIGVILIAICVKFVIEVIDWFIDKFGITTLKSIKKKEQTEQINETEKALENIVSSNNNIANEIDKMSKRIEIFDIKINQLDERTLKIENQCGANNEANIMQLHDRLEQKCRYYIETLKGIPENEYQGFVDMFNSYEKLGGNHGMDKKVKYCIDNLPIIPSTLFLMRNVTSIK